MKRLIFSIVMVGLAAGLYSASPSRADNLSYVVKVNDQPITSYDLSQRQKYIALTSGQLGKRMRAELQSESTKRKFQQFMQQQQPGSRSEAEALQQKFVSRMQNQVMRDIQSETRDKALEQLINEQLKLGEAKDRKVSVNEANVDQLLKRMANSVKEGQTADEFLAAFRKQGVGEETIRQRMRARLAWRDVIRKIYGFRISSLVGADSGETNNSDSSAAESVFNVRKLRIPAGRGEAALARAYVRGQTIRKRFSSCGKLARLAERAGDVEISSHSGKKAAFFPRDARPLLIQASEGQMLPPVLSSGGVDLYAVCGKKAPKRKEVSDGSQTSQSDRRQQEFQIYARRHLNDLRQRATIDRR